MSASNTEFLTKNTYPDMAQAQQYLDYMYEEVSVSLYGTNSSSDSELNESLRKHNNPVSFNIAYTGLRYHSSKNLWNIENSYDMKDIFLQELWFTLILVSLKHWKQQ